VARNSFISISQRRRGGDGGGDGGGSCDGGGDEEAVNGGGGGWGGEGGGLPAPVDLNRDNTAQQTFHLWKAMENRDMVAADEVAVMDFLDAMYGAYCQGKITKAQKNVLKCRLMYDDATGGSVAAKLEKCNEELAALVVAGGLDTANDAALASALQQHEDAKAAAEAEAGAAPLSKPALARADSFARFRERARDEVFAPALVAAEGCDGLLARLYAYLRVRMRSLHKTCVICDAPHVSVVSHFFEQGSAMILRPTVCHRDTCVFAFTEFSLGADGADGLATQAEVMDLVMAFSVAAANSPRANIILNPFPRVVDEDNTPVLDPETPDFAKAKELFNLIPSVEALVGGSRGSLASLAECCNAGTPHGYALVQWCMSSNRAHVEALDPGKHLKAMKTKHQFIMRNSGLEREGKFQELKKQHGSCFAFHGSPIENWHAILRNGLHNASGTKLQMHGAAYGKGIYASPSAMMSAGYSYMGQGARYRRPGGAPAGGGAKKKPSVTAGNRFLGGENIKVMALCEIIDTGIHKSGDVWVVPSEEHIVTRFFFCFTKDTVPQCHTVRDADFRASIESAMKQISKK